MIPKKLLLKKVTISKYSIYGAADSPTQNGGGNASTQSDPTDETNSSAYHDPTENPIYPLLLSMDAAVCA